MIDAIGTDDAPLQAALANVWMTIWTQWNRGVLEATVAYLLSKDPVVKGRNLAQQSGRRLSANISDINAKTEVADFGANQALERLVLIYAIKVLNT